MEDMMFGLSLDMKWNRIVVYASLFFVPHPYQLYTICLYAGNYALLITRLLRRLDPHENLARPMFVRAVDKRNRESLKADVQ